MRGMGPQNDNIGATYFLNRPDRYKYNYIAARLSYIWTNYQLRTLKDNDSKIVQEIKNYFKAS